MIRIIGITISFVMLYTVLSFCQSMKVYTKSTVQTFPLTDIDSITFEFNEVNFPTDLKFISNEVMNWAEVDSEYRRFRTLEELYLLINGKADTYAARGVIEGFQQLMLKSGASNFIIVRVMDFGTIAKATDIYNFKLSYISPAVKAGSYSDSVAILDPAPLPGCYAYAHFNRYYIELSLSGYGSAKSESFSDATTFLELFESKIN